jgi:hypothetical protein
MQNALAVEPARTHSSLSERPGAAHPSRDCAALPFTFEPRAGEIDHDAAAG